MIGPPSSISGAFAFAHPDTPSPTGVAPATIASDATGLVTLVLVTLVLVALVLVTLVLVTSGPWCSLASRERWTSL